jgi:predicted transcriptional regulator
MNSKDEVKKTLETLENLVKGGFVEKRLIDGEYRYWVTDKGKRWRARGYPNEL